MAESRAEHLTSLETLRGLLSKRPHLESQRQVVVDFLKPKAEFVKSNLPSRPFLEKLGSSVATFGGAYMSLDGWINLSPYVQAQKPLDENAMFIVGLRIIQGLVGAWIVTVADNWKKSIWRRENQ